MVSQSVSELACVFSSSRLIFLRAGVLRGLLSIDLVSGELAFVIFSFGLSILENTARVFAKKSCQKNVTYSWVYVRSRYAKDLLF